jgi:tRNA-splicing ligase RtcB (3'-phosphate/5'-hydroxy nucleic acid ligase)
MSEGAAVRRWHHGPLPREVETALERLARSDDVRRIAVMPDVHLSADVCVGTVLATGRTLYPNAVGGDIGCGVAALAFEAEAAALDDDRAAAAVLARLYRTIPLIRHRRGDSVLTPPLRERPLSTPRLEARKEEAAQQIGTLGRGNHFVELQADEEGRLWLMLHSGSRGIGQAIRDHHLARGVAGRSGLRYLEAGDEHGRQYLGDMAWALEYAEASRLAMVEAVRQALRAVLGVEADTTSFVSCNHNHVRREAHGGEELWVHRKGAISAQAGEPGLVPGSMGTHSFHVEGRGCVEALASSAHGAGRRLSRTEARHSLSARDVLRQLGRVRFDHRLAADLREEAPSAYKDIDDVLRAEADLVRIVRRLRPVLVFKGG